MSIYNIYIDESCHLEHDTSNIMTVGYIKVADSDAQSIKDEIKAIKRKYGVLQELKWNTMSNTSVAMYKELIDYFFDKPLYFRCLIVKYKDRLQHQVYNEGRHDIFYDKMIFYLLSNHWLNNTQDEYKVFLDIKDTRGREKLVLLNEIFNNKFQNQSPFKHFQHIRSHESQFIQLTDILIGAVTYKARKLHLLDTSSAAKKEIVRYLELKSGYDIDESTEPWETKFNIFDHQPRRQS
jgi:hypothetical protein